MYEALFWYTLGLLTLFAALAITAVALRIWIAIPHACGTKFAPLIWTVLNNLPAKRHL